MDMDFVFSEAMKSSLTKNRMDLVANLMKVEEIVDYLNQEDVFLNAEDILCTPKRKDQVRNLLGRLDKRPARDYWKFIACLYNRRIRQEHIAEIILRTFESCGGQITEPNIRQLRQNYLGNQGQPSQPERFREESSPQPLQNQSHDPPDLRYSDDLTESLYHEGFVTEGGSLVECETQSLEASNFSVPVSMDYDLGIPNLAQAASASSVQTKYQKARSKPDGHKVYKMESTPRGLALIINNVNFEHFDYRGSAEHDLIKIKHLLEEVLYFDVEVLEDKTAQQMKTAVKRFSENPRFRDVDSAILVIMSHGSDNGIIFGTDGKLIGASPLENTFLRVIEIRDMFSSSVCQALCGKPKLFILQACRGDKADTVTGHERVGMDIVCENRPQCHMGGDHYDMCTLYPSVEGYVAYRQYFIPFLVEVFTQLAHEKCFQCLVRELHGRIKQVTISETYFTTTENKECLTKKWYLNPRQL